MKMILASVSCNCQFSSICCFFLASREWFHKILINWIKYTAKIYKSVRLKKISTVIHHDKFIRFAYCLLLAYLYTYKCRIKWKSKVTTKLCLNKKKMVFLKISQRYNINRYNFCVCLDETWQKQMYGRWATTGKFCCYLKRNFFFPFFLSTSIILCSSCLFGLPCQCVFSMHSV